MDLLVKGLLLTCVILCFAFGVSRCQYKELQTYTAEYKAAVFEKLVEVNQKARAEEHAKQAEVNRIGTEYEIRENQIRKDLAVKFAADLKSGTVKLRQHWQACNSPASTVPGSTTGTSESNAAQQLREADIAHLREIGALADAKEKALQEYALTCSALAKP